MQKNYEPIPLGDTSNLSEAEWLKWRDHGPKWNSPLDPDYIPYCVGGSDIATIAGCSPWKTVLELYHQKIGVEPKYKLNFNEEAKEAGHIFEPFVAFQFLRYMKANFSKLKIVLIKDIFRDMRPYIDLFLGDTNLNTKVQKILDSIFSLEVDKWGINPNMLFQCGEKDEKGRLKYPFAVANLDGLLTVNGKRGIFEAKTTSPNNYKAIEKWKAGICPQYYEYQCRYYMKIMNLDFVYITCCWGYKLDEMAVVLIKRDNDAENEMMKLVSEFISNVELGISPSLDSCNPELLNSYYSRLYGETDNSIPTVELSDQYKQIVLQAMLIEEDVKNAEKKLDEAKLKKEKIYSSLYPVYGKANYGTYRLNDKSVVALKLVTPMHKAHLDLDKLKSEEPSVFQKYATKFDTTSFGKEEPALKRKYMVSKTPNFESGKNTFELSVKDIPL